VTKGRDADARVRGGGWNTRNDRDLTRVRAGNVVWGEETLMDGRGHHEMPIRVALVVVEHHTFGDKPREHDGYEFEGHPKLEGKTMTHNPRVNVGEAKNPAPHKF